MFNYMWTLPPIDEFSDLIIVDGSTRDNVISNMPEVERTNNVYKMYIPYDNFIVPVYLCKADNNGTVYLFSDYDVFGYLIKNVKEDK